MNQKEKQEIVKQLEFFVQNKGSQNKAANSLKGVSSAVISHLLNRNWEPYSDEMFRNIGNQIGYCSKSWQFVNTTNADFILKALEKTKQQQSVVTILAPAGSGKSEISKKFAEENNDVIRIECASYWDEKRFLQEILMKLGVKSSANRISDMMEAIIKAVEKFHTPPQLEFDEVDKLGDRLLYFLITFYNELKWKCSIVLLSTYYFKKRLDDGVRNRRKGYEELLSRFGTFIEFEYTSAADIKLLCEGQGIKNTPAIRAIQKKANADLRIASELIRIYKLENGI